MQALWRPTPAMREHAHMTHFMQAAQQANPHCRLTDYTALHAWSIQQPEVFWPAVWRYCQLRYQKKWDQVVTYGAHMIDTQWFWGCTLNYAQNLLRFQDDHLALIFTNERGERRTLTYQQLHQQVKRAAAGLQALGVQRGDRVAGLLPNVPEAVIALLACASLGAIWSSCSPDFGLQGILDRFGQIQPKVLFTVDGYAYGGREIDIRDRVKRLIAQLPTLKQVITIPYSPICDGIVGVRWMDWLAQTRTQTLHYTAVPFQHPLYILYSSGTTGIPKCIVHSTGGVLLQHAKELMLHTDLHRSDRIFYFTTCGWMMWNWLVSSLSVGATVVLYDGNPCYPDAQALWDMAQREAVSVFGTSAKYLSAIQKAGVTPIHSHALNALRTILSTGSPLPPTSFDYVYEHIKPDVQLSSISGGTDIVSCFALGNPLLPVVRGELQCKGLGMAVAVMNEHGRTVIGEKGELTCTAPFPSMPVGFWRDEQRHKYQQAYFTTYPNVWAQGDFAEETAHGGLIIYGRSDAVLNPGGVRIGTAEIYRPTESLDEVMECIAVGQNWAPDSRIVLFVKLKQGLTLNSALEDKIRQTIRAQATKRHVPAKILQVTDIPRTRSGKIAELAVRCVIHQQTVNNAAALANPEALAQYRNRLELAN